MLLLLLLLNENNSIRLQPTLAQQGWEARTDTELPLSSRRKFTRRGGDTYNARPHIMSSTKSSGRQVDVTVESSKPTMGAMSTMSAKVDAVVTKISTPPQFRDAGGGEGTLIMNAAPRGYWLLDLDPDPGRALLSLTPFSTLRSLT